MILRGGVVRKTGQSSAWRASGTTPASGDRVRTFASITTDANELVADIHDRMPVIVAPADYARWLGEERDLMRSYPAELMRMWGRSRRA
jgi:putative SOS response-associated peptidase YedK